MRSHSDHLGDHPQPLQSDCAIPTRTHVPCKNIDSEEISQSQQMEPAKIRSQCESHGHATTIDSLPDNVLLDIFEFIRNSRPAYKVRFYPVWKWQPLVRVCHRWREIIFASPLRLDLQVLCTHRRPVMDYLDCWPPTFPIAVDYGYSSGKHLTPDDEDNMFTTLEIREIRERIRLLRLSMTDGVLAEVINLMQEPFPELRNLAISSYPGRDTRGLDGPALPNNFLGGSAPSLRKISFHGIRFPALPTLLSSASDLVKLTFVNIPKTAYFPPAAFAACLAVLPRLEHLSIGFQSQHSRTTGDRTHLPPGTQAVLPSLTSFTFVGESAYLEVVMPQVDTPQLYSVDITYTDQEDFEVTELFEFIERSGIKPSWSGHAEISLEHDSINFYFFLQSDTDEPTIAIQLLSDEEIDQLVNIMARALNQTSTMLSDVVRLKITFDRDWKVDDDDTVHDIEWLELFRPFTAVKKLRIYEKLAESISHELEDQKVLPALESICKEDPWEDQRPARGMKELIADLLQRGKLLSSGGEGLDSDDSE